MESNFGEKIKYIRTSRGLSQDEFGELLGTSKQVISRYENNQRTPKITVAKAFSDTLRVPLDYLIDDSISVLIDLDFKEIKNFSYIPIIKTITTGANGVAEMELEGYESVSDLKNPDQHKAFAIKGDSMATQILDGDIAIVHMQNNIEDGEIAVVVVNGEEGTIRKIQKHDNALSLVSFNAEYPARIFIGKEIDDVVIYGKVVEIKRKF